MNEASTNSTIPSPGGARHRRWLAAAAAAAALLVVTPVVAHSGAFGPAFGPVFGSTFGPALGADGGRPGAPGFGMGMHGGAVAGMRGGTFGGAFGGMHGAAYGGMHGAAYGGMRGGALGPMALQRLPLGTEVTVQVYDADPAQGAQPIATLAATVGETSEVAFADEVQAATTDAAFVTVLTGPRTARVALGVDADLRRAPMAGLMRFGALEQGQSVEVAFFAGEGDAVPSTTLTFTYGEDSAAAFHQAVVDASAEAAVAEISLPAQERTVDLSVTPWAGARDAAGRAGYGVDRGYGPGMGRQMRPGSGFGPRAVPSDPPTF